MIYKNMRWLLLIPIVFSIIAHADEEKAVTERIQLLEEQRGYHFKKRKFQLIAEGEALYWKADVDGVAYATTNIDAHAQGAVGDVSTNIKTRTPHFSYDPGFRIGIGIQSPYDLFDVFFVWTRFYTDGHDRARGTLVPIILTPGEKEIFDGIGLIEQMESIPNTASADCQIKANLLDLQLARGIEVSRHFFMRPYFGVRAMSLDLDWDIKIDRDYIIPSIFNQDSTNLKVDNDFRAVGGLIGLELDWKIWRGFGLNAKAAGALVYGPSSEKTTQKYFFVPSGSAIESKQDFKAENACHTVKGMYEIFTGVFWETHFAMDKRQGKSLLKKKKRRESSFRLYAGYEFQQWPLIGQKTNTQVTRFRERFPVGFHGLTAGAKLVF